MEVDGHWPNNAKERPAKHMKTTCGLLLVNLLGPGTQRVEHNMRLHWG